MDELESQIAKIQLGNNKSSSSYVFILAEKAPAGSAELYVVAELPLFNPAAEESCERICLAIASSLKRSYKKNSVDNAFENAIAAINEELGKLASLGQTEWVNKLNCILAAKEGDNLHIATCGKTSAYLLRNHEYTDISNSQAISHPLKTFENYATGKIRLGDILILSTTQLFNYLSMDRLLSIVSNADFLTATQTVIELLKETAEPQVSFGVLLNLQVPVGQVEEADVDLENYVVEKPQSQENPFTKIFNYAKVAFSLNKNESRVPKVDLPRTKYLEKSSQNAQADNLNDGQQYTRVGIAGGLPTLSFGEKLKNLGSGTKNLVAKGQGFWQDAKIAVLAVGSTVKPANFRSFSPAKKFFLISAALLLIAVISNISIASHLKKTQTNQQQVTNQLKEIQTLLSNAEASLLYKDEAKAADFFAQAKNKLPPAASVGSANQDLYKKVLALMSEAQTQMEKNFNVQASNLGSLGAGDSLIKLPEFLAIQVNKTIISYNKSAGSVQDNALTASATISGSSYISGKTAAIYDNGSLYVWDYSTGKLSPGFSQSVPAKGDFAGLAAYPVNSRVYLVDKKSAAIISFASGKTGFAKPVIAAKDPVLAKAVDLAIDGNVYVLSSTGINKFAGGKLADFVMPSLATPLSGAGKIYTQKDFKYLYVLDSGNNRILILDKKGNLVNTLKSSEFTKLKDFQVDEKNKVIYALNDGSLLKIILP